MTLESGDDGRARALELLDRLVRARKRERRDRELLTHPESRTRPFLFAEESLKAPLPEDACARDWAFDLGTWFAGALDIRLQELFRNSVPYYCWTQGSSFHFREGYTLHRRDGLLAMQVKKSRRAKPAAEASARDPGLALADVYARMDKSAAWKFDRQIELTQDGLVRMLIAG